MVNASFYPLWIHQLNGISDLVSAFVAFLIAYYSFKIYKYSSDYRYRLFGIAFLGISLSFIAKLIANTFIYYELAKTNFFTMFVPAPNLLASLITNSLWTNALLLGGLVLFAAVALKIEDKRVIYLLFIISIIASYFGRSDGYYMVHIIGAIILFFVFPIFYKNYQDKKTRSSYFVFLTFLVLFIAFILFLLINIHSYFYILAMWVQLLGFIIFLINHMLVYQK